MYKNIVLGCLILLSIFSNKESYCFSEDLNSKIFGGIVTLAVGNITYACVTIHNSIYPDPTAQVNAKYSKAKLEWLKCLENSKKNSEKNEHGIPLNCEETARAFIMCGGFDEIINITKHLK